MTQTVNNDRLHWGRTNSNSLGMWSLLSSLTQKQKHFIDVETIKGAMSQILE